jgi:hypothetical protein
MATGTDHRPQKKAKPKRGDFREEVNAARTSSAHAALVSEPLAPAWDSSQKRTVGGRTSPQTLYVPLLTQTHIQL